MIIAEDTLAWYNFLITAGYAITCTLLLNHATHACESPVMRLKYALLGIAFLGYGVGKTLLLFSIYMSWMFVMGHFAFIAFGLVFFLYGRRRVSK